MAFATGVPIGLGLLLVWEFAITLGGQPDHSAPADHPDRLQGQVNSTVRMIAIGGQALCAALGGSLADRLSLRTTYLAMAACVAGIVVTIAFSPIRRIGHGDVLEEVCRGRSRDVNETDERFSSSRVVEASSGRCVRGKFGRCRRSPGDRRVGRAVVLRDRRGRRSRRARCVRFSIRRRGGGPWRRSLLARDRRIRVR